VLVAKAGRLARGESPRGVSDACWEALVQRAQKMGEQELAAGFEQARIEEDEHLVRVRQWIATSQDREELAAE
jgi:hypothetical protein